MRIRQLFAIIFVASVAMVIAVRNPEQALASYLKTINNCEEIITSFGKLKDHKQKGSAVDLSSKSISTYNRIYKRAKDKLTTYSLAKKSCSWLSKAIDEAILKRNRAQALLEVFLKVHPELKSEETEAALLKKDRTKIPRTTTKKGNEEKELEKFSI